MSDTFTKEICIQEPECDITKKLRLSNFMRHAQQIGSDHLANRNIDYNTLYNDGMVFLVSKMLVKINRRPEFGEKVSLTTIPRQAKGAQFIRDTIFETNVGEKLAEVSISWLLINPETHKILRPKVFDQYGFSMASNEGEYITTYRIKRPAGNPVHHLRQIKYSDLDYNHHVNNAAYADIVCDVLPLGMFMNREISQFGIMYHREARIGQIMEISVISPEERTMPYYILGDVIARDCFEAEISFK